MSVLSRSETDGQLKTLSEVINIHTKSTYVGQRHCRMQNVLSFECDPLAGQHLLYFNLEVELFKMTCATTHGH